MKILLTFFFILQIFCGYSQLDSLTMQKMIDKSKVVDRQKEELKVHCKFELDSSEIQVWKMDNKFTSEVYFHKGGTELYITGYMENGKIYLAKIIEENINTKESEDLYKETLLFYQKQNLQNIDVSYRIQPCAGVLNFDEFYKYNKNLTSKYLEELIFKILEKLNK